MDPLPVGLIFGPSGCGKSSFVKAGLIPRLPAGMKTVYLEAGPEETEQRLLDKLNTIAASSCPRRNAPGDRLQPHSTRPVDDWREAADRHRPV